MRLNCRSRLSCRLEGMLSLWQRSSTVNIIRAKSDLCCNLNIMNQEQPRQEHQNLIVNTGPDPNAGGQGGAMPSIISETSHPFIAAIHIILKIAIVFLYLVLPFMTSTFNVLVFVVIASAVDFWIVKNLAGRLLVGLRWWIAFAEDGEEQWKFECKVNEKDVSWSNEKAFWWTQVLFTLIWLVLSVINVLKLNITQITICVYSFTLLFFNLYSYYKCSGVQKENVNKLIGQYGA